MTGSTLCFRHTQRKSANSSSEVPFATVRFKSSISAPVSWRSCFPRYTIGGGRVCGWTFTIAVVLAACRVLFRLLCLASARRAFCFRARGLLIFAITGLFLRFRIQMDVLVARSDVDSAVTSWRLRMDEFVVDLRRDSGVTVDASGGEQDL